MQATINTTSSHFVYVVDQDGLISIFGELRKKLVMQHHVTLICFSFQNSFLFNGELEILQRRYASQIIVYQLREELLNASTSIQELLEVVINSNTKDNLIFILSHDEELVHIVSNRLWFLGIPKNKIQIC